jgi:phage N-6-adenine-methyltransferase
MSDTTIAGGEVKSMTTSQNRFYDSHDAGEKWATPGRIWRPLANALGGFDLDPAAGCEPTPIASNRFTVEDNGLAKDWYGDVWLNPPYGREHNEKWAMKAASEARRDAVDTLTALVPNSLGAAWYQDYYGTADLETHIRGRIEFIGEKDDPASFYSVLVTWGDVPEEYIDSLHGLGEVREIVPNPDGTRQTALEVAADE